MRVAALDLGTNTFLLLIAEIESGRVARILHDEVRVVRLGQGVDKTRSFHPEALQRARQCLTDYANTVQQFKVDRTLACATSAARDVSNQHELLDIAAKLSLPLQIISGDREAELTFRGTWSDPDSKETILVIDVGGGSTEYIVGDRGDGRGRIVARQSLDIGSVRLTEKFVTHHPISQSEIASMQSKIMNEMQTLRPEIRKAKVDRIVAVAGTPTTLAAIEQKSAFDATKIEGHHLSNQALHEWIDKMAAMTVEQRQALAGMEPKRADVIVAGAQILALSSDAFGKKTLNVSTRGLRFGIALSLGDS